MKKIASRLFTLSASLLFLTACSHQNNATQGYIEGDLTYLASTQPGRLSTLDVHRGEKVKKGQPLFSIEQEPRLSKVHAAEAALRKAEFNLADLQKGERPSQLKALQAQIKGAQAQVVYAEKQLQRTRVLVSTDAVQQQLLDLSKQNAEVAEEKVAELEQELVTAKLPARVDQIKAARASLQEAAANLNVSDWNLKQTVVRSPANATVFDNLYWPGEEVPSSQPVITLLIPSQIKVVFFIPEPELSQLKLGQTIQIQATNASEASSAKVSFISPSAEYTPPVIYSRERSSKLVYRVEAQFANAKTAYAWHPGQPVVIHFAKA